MPAMGTRVIAPAVAIAFAVVVAVAVAVPAARASTTCTWGGTPAAPTGVTTQHPGITNDPSPVRMKFTATGGLAGGPGCGGRGGFRGGGGARAGRGGVPLRGVPRGGAR